jgi:rubrerythrin
MNNNINNIRNAIYDWIKEDAPLSVKLVLIPNHIESLENRIFKSIGETMENNKGWECPRCGSVNSPQKDKCQCIKTESTDKDTKQLLVE